jgi:hypothetical protein
MAFERRDAGAVRSRGARQALVKLLCLALLFGGSLVGLLHTPLLSIALSFLSQIGCIERCLLRTSSKQSMTVACKTCCGVFWRRGLTRAGAWGR